MGCSISKAMRASVALPPRIYRGGRFGSVFELRHRLQLVLGRVVDGVVGIPVSVGLRDPAAVWLPCPVVRPSRPRQCAALLSTFVAGRSPWVVVLAVVRTRRLIRPFQLVIGDGDVMLAHAEEAADAQDDVRDLAGLVQDESLMSPIFSLASL